MNKLELVRGDTNQGDKNWFVGTRTKGTKIGSWGHEPRGQKLVRGDTNQGDKIAYFPYKTPLGVTL